MAKEYGLLLGLQSVEAEIAAEARKRKEEEAVIIAMMDLSKVVPDGVPSLFVLPSAGVS